MATIRITKNEATAARRRVCFHCVDAADGITAETGEAGGQPQVSVDGGAWTNTGIGTLVSIGNGRYYAELTQALTNTDYAVISTRYKSANTAEALGDTAVVDKLVEDAAAAKTLLENETYGLSAIETLVDDLESRLTATRAGYLDNLDVAVSTRMATFTYTAPDNATVAAIDGKVDALNDLSVSDVGVALATYDVAKSTDIPSDYATATAVAAIPTTPLLAENYTAPDNAGIAAAVSAIGELNDISAADVHYTLEAYGVATVTDIPTDYATEATVAAIPTNPLLVTDTRLNNLDATVSSRLATTGYTAPDNAGITSANNKIDALNDISTAEVAAELTAYGAAKVSDLPTNYSTFDPTTDTVARVTLVDTTTDVTNAVTATVDTSGIAEDVWTHSDRTLTSATGGGATAAEIWTHANRSLTDKAGFSGEATNLPTDYAKPADVQVTVPTPTFSGTVEFAGTVEVPAPVFGGTVTIDPPVALQPDEREKLLSIPTNPVLATDSRLANLDATVSSRLATSGYTAPSNATIAAIDSKVDALNDLSATDVSTALSTYGTAKTTDIPTDYAKPADVQVTVPTPTFSGTVEFAGTVDVPAPIFDGTVTIDPPVALRDDERTKLLSIPTNPLLTTDARLNNLDAPVSSRSTLTQSQVWTNATRSLTDKSGFALTAAYDAAKTAASQASVASIGTAVGEIIPHGDTEWKTATIDAELVATEVGEALIEVGIVQQIADAVADSIQGGGSVPFVYTVATVGGTPLEGVTVTVRATDDPTATIVAKGSTDATGKVAFMLDEGVYYIWSNKSGIAFSNPDVETVTAP